MIFIRMHVKKHEFWNRTLQMVISEKLKMLFVISFFFPMTVFLNKSTYVLTCIEEQFTNKIDGISQMFNHSFHVSSVRIQQTLE